MLLRLALLLLAVASLATTQQCACTCANARCHADADCKERLPADTGYDCECKKGFEDAGIAKGLARGFECKSCPAAAYDVVFAIDTSFDTRGSYADKNAAIIKRNQEMIQRYMKELSSRLVEKEPLTRFGISQLPPIVLDQCLKRNSSGLCVQRAMTTEESMIYNKAITPWCETGAIPDRIACMNRYIATVEYNWGRPCTKSLLEASYRNFFKAANYQGGTRKKMIIIITDGEMLCNEMALENGAYYGRYVENEADLVKTGKQIINEGTRILTVAVNANDVNLQKMKLYSADVIEVGSFENWEIPASVDTAMAAIAQPVCV